MNPVLKLKLVNKIPEHVLNFSYFGFNASSDKEANINEMLQIFQQICSTTFRALVDDVRKRILLRSHNIMPTSALPYFLSTGY
jgi:hypothetical protein